MATPTLGNTRDMRGLPFTPAFQAPRRPYNSRYGASVSEIMSQRGNNTGAYNQQGQMLPAGTVLQAQGWNTRGFGPGTPGYRGSGGSQGYSFERQGTAANKRTPDYSTHFGGLNEFGRMQQGMSDFDRLQNERSMDQQDAVGSQLAQFARIAGERGDTEAMDMYSRALSDRAAQRMAAQRGGFGGVPSGPADAWSDRTTLGGGAPPLTASPMNRPLHSWEEQAMRRAEIDGDPFAPQLDPNSPEVQALLDQEDLDSRRSLQPGESATSTPRLLSRPSTFTNAQGSAGPGETRTAYGGVESGPDFFQGAANRQRSGNAFAQPQSGFNGRVANDLDAYSQRLLQAKQRLGKA